MGQDKLECGGTCNYFTPVCIRQTFLSKDFFAYPFVGPCSYIIIVNLDVNLVEIMVYDVNK